ncbi:DUF1776-domain-containing protein [Ceratocystis lukuohia]|uniref:DUF1776-domain-containing protein n=1 Tax=Ceratocystis lukuohia TaxID=2019550 RepID=A0ABR4MC46_9PEZI
MTHRKDIWTAEEYQSSASFVPKLATKVVQWLDVQKDDVVLDLGCGDGILDEQFIRVLRQGSGRLTGLDSSVAMIEAARKLVPDENASFEVADCSKLDALSHITTGIFTKVFSNAAMHWILSSTSTRTSFFRGVREATAPGGLFVFEMGGLGNISEMRTAILMAAARHIGLQAAISIDPWFFPDEAYVTHMLQSEVGGFLVLDVEREWRPTPADAAGVDGTEATEFVDKQIDFAAGTVRNSLSSVDWLPSSIRPALPTPPPEPVIPQSMLESAQTWVVRNRVLIGITVIFTGTIAYKTYRSTASARKIRRARRAKNNGRVEVVVVAGSPTLPLTRALSLDLERKGFIVYVVCNGPDDELLLQRMARPDIRPLGIDITDPPRAGVAIERFANYLQSRHSPGPTVTPNYLALKGVILIPSVSYQTSPIATIPPSSFADLFNTHLLHPILTIQAFLPLLTARLTPAGEKWAPPKVMVFTPSIISSINPPFHAPEATVCSALSAFTEVLAAELRPLSIPVTHIQLGTFDFSSFSPSRSSQHPQGLLPSADADATSWPENARHAYGRNYVTSSASAISGGRIRGLRGSSLRYLHNAVFDVIDGSVTSDVVRIGLGANVYGFVGRWVPRSLVTWMMGVRKVDELHSWQNTHELVSYQNDEEMMGDEDGDEMTESKDFIAVSHEADEPSNVWK